MEFVLENTDGFVIILLYLSIKKIMAAFSEINIQNISNQYSNSRTKKHHHVLARIYPNKLKI